MGYRLETRDLEVGYQDQPVITGVNMALGQGDMLTLLGPNGSGKSTILKTLAGTLSPLSGEVLIKGRSSATYSKKELSHLMAVVMTRNVDPGLTTVREIVALGRQPYTGFFGRLGLKDQERVDEALDAVGAMNLADRFFNDLSDGEKQKVMIARALSQEPEILILDEPTSHLDIGHKVEIMTILNRLAMEKGVTIIMSLHDIDLAVKGSQALMLIRDGQIVDEGRPEEVVNGDVIQNLYQIHGAYYDDLVGNLEFEGPSSDAVFIVAGGGTGIPIYRAFARENIGMATGILYSGDQDTEVGKTLCHHVVKAPDFSPVDNACLEEAKGWIDRCPVIVDSGFPNGEGSVKNIDLLDYARKEGKTIYSLRDEPIEGEVRCSNLRDLITKVRETLGSRIS